MMVKEPCHKTLDSLNELAKDPNNYILIFSNNTKEMMHSWYSEISPKIGLAAENGFYWRKNSEK